MIAVGAGGVNYESVIQTVGCHGRTEEGFCRGTAANVAWQKGETGRRNCSGLARGGGGGRGEDHTKNLEPTEWENDGDRDGSYTLLKGAVPYSCFCMEGFIEERALHHSVVVSDVEIVYFLPQNMGM